MARAQARHAQQEIRQGYTKRRLTRLIWALVVVLVLLLALAQVATYYWAEGLWFDELGFLAEFLLRSRTQIALGTFALLASLGFTFFNLNLAERLQFNRNCILPNQANLSIGLGLKGFLPVIFFLGAVIGAGLFHHGQITLNEIRSVRAAIPTPIGLNF
ncbi:MAG: UPF0182 family protein, partial [Cyanobacteria bacterium J06632_3]